MLSAFLFSVAWPCHANLYPSKDTIRAAASRESAFLLEMESRFAEDGKFVPKLQFGSEALKQISRFSGLHNVTGGCDVAIVAEIQPNGTVPRLFISPEQALFLVIKSDREVNFDDTGTQPHYYRNAVIKRITDLSAIKEKMRGKRLESKLIELQKDLVELKNWAELVSAELWIGRDCVASSEKIPEEQSEIFALRDAILDAKMLCYHGGLEFLDESLATQHRALEIYLYAELTPAIIRSCLGRWSRASELNSGFRGFLIPDGNSLRVFAFEAPYSERTSWPLPRWHQALFAATMKPDSREIEQQLSEVALTDNNEKIPLLSMNGGGQVSLGTFEPAAANVGRFAEEDGLPILGLGEEVQNWQITQRATNTAL